MAIPRLFVGDMGIKLRLYTGIDITGNYTLSIEYKKPDGVTGSWSAEEESTYYCTYILQSGDLDTAGEWEIQTYIVSYNESDKIHGDITKLFVYTPVT